MNKFWRVFHKSRYINRNKLDAQREELQDRITQFHACVSEKQQRGLPGR